MKTTVLILALAGLVFSRATAQVTLEVTLNQEEFLAGESLPVAVKITNQSGQQIHLGLEPDWLTFSVESADGFVVVKNSEVPVLGAFDLESSQLGIKRVDIAPYFNLPKPGRYTVTATLHIKSWGLTLTSPKKMFDVITGADLWSQDFGIPTTNGLPEMRRYTLEQASYLHSQMRLYMQLSDPAIARVYKTAALGQAVSFARPQGQVDRLSQLHVLWQSGAQSFDYCIISPEGAVIEREIYDDYNTRPRLVVNSNGDVLVAGGVRRPKPGELPQISQPAETSPPIQAQATSAPVKQ